MDDRTLLERAAKAADVDIYEWNDGAKGAWLNDGEGGYWNPLHDDGDALRLAVKLRFRVEQADAYSVCYAGTVCAKQFSERCGRDPYAATRRAIVRAAAAMEGSGE